MARLIDRLTVRLGANRVRRPVPQREPFAGAGERVGGRRILPTVSGAKAVHRAIPLHHALGAPPSNAGRTRPQRLLDRPEAIAVIYATPEGMPRRFVWRRGVHDIARVEGPERIAPEWWRQPARHAAARLLPGRG